MPNEVKICSVCLRTDAFSPGQIDHDKDWHEALDYIKNNQDDREYIASLEKVKIELK
ncbi:MAG: hypothetical protein KGL39_31935 [Patescibacteria group bacterium]|nr:hypothetical protein [Patescibacteria group bacterium]